MLPPFRASLSAPICFLYSPISFSYPFSDNRKNLSPDADAAVYYLARMLYAGEDIRFIARRIMICASEDVSNADPL